jgi:two-component system, OmpR family, response regulator
MPPGTATILRFDGFALDLAGRSLHDPSGQNVALTAAQFRLLEMLASHPGHVLSRDHISEAVGTRQTTPYDRSVDVLISRLRQKIEVDPQSAAIDYYGSRRRI